MDNNTSYKTQAIDLNLLSVLDITKDGKVVSAEKWVELWTLVFRHINKIDAFCVDMQSTLDNWHEAEIALNEIIEDMQIKYDALSTEFIHYGENPPENPHIMLWVRRRNDITPNYLLTNEDVDSELSSTSENPVQNKVVNTALSNKMDKNNPTGTGSFSLNRRANTTVGSNSHAEGYNAEASGSVSHAEGNNTKASGGGSHAEGWNTNASGNNSHAEGGSTTASGYVSHAEGDSTKASGSNSHAEGYFTKALGDNSHAEGMYTVASSDYQHVQGKYNIADTTTYADIIGNGKSDTERSNASTVDWQGNVWYAGDVYVGSTSGTNRDEGSKKLATEEVVLEAVSTEQARANNTFTNVLKGSKSGSAILIDDVSPITHEMGVKVSGKNLIPYPYSETTKTINGITFTDNRDGTITVNGTSTNSTSFWLHPSDSVNLKAGTYTLSGCPSGGSHGTYCLVCTISNSTTPSIDGIEQTFYDIGNGITFEVTFDVFVCWNIYIEWDVTVDNLVFKPQLELGTTATAYTPYVDLTAVKVSRYGKNLFNQANPKIGTLGGYSNTYVRNLEDDTWYCGLALSGYYITSNLIDYSINENYITVKTKTSESDSLYGLTKALKCKPNTKYTLSYTMENGNTQNASGIGFYGADKKHISFVYCDSGSSFTTPSNCYWIIVCFHGNAEDTYATYSDIQLELGTTVTDYEPYITPTEYTPTADGTVNGVTSLYPNTTLLTDTYGVIIDCEYNRDINKAFAALEAAIATNNS